MKKALTFLFTLVAFAALAQQTVQGNLRVSKSLYVVNDVTARGDYDLGQGFELYQDSSTVYASHQVIAQGDTATIENDALGTNDLSQSPYGIDAMYSSSLIQGAKVGDVLVLRVDFTASSDASGGAGKGILYLDVDGSSIAQVPVFFVAADTTTNLSYTFEISVNVTQAMVSSGAAVKFYSIAGNTKMYAQRFTIFRVHKGK